MSQPFRFKQFNIAHDKCAMKVGTDSVVLGAWASPEGKNILDIGTGSGLLSLMIAQRNKLATIDAIEIDIAAAEQAMVNFKSSPWNSRLSVINEDILAFKPGRKYDLVISNPPYFLNSTLPPDKKRLTARHSSSLMPEKLLQKVTEILADDGKFSLILPFREGLSFIEMAKAFHLYPGRLGEFKPNEEKKSERLLIELSRQKSVPVQEKLIHYDENGKWSEGYIALTKDFYIVL